MRVFYDCEFLEDGKTIELISIGMAAQDGRELYLVNEGIEGAPLYDRICRHEFLMPKVVPHLPLRPGSEAKQPYAQYPGAFHLDLASNVVMPLRMIRNEVREFVLSDDEPELWAWYGAYDHVALAQLFGRMVHLPKGIPMWTNDLKQEVHRLGNPELPKQEGVEHHALADARWARDAYNWLAAREKGEG